MIGARSGESGIEKPVPVCSHTRYHWKLFVLIQIPCDCDVYMFI